MTARVTALAIAILGSTSRQNNSVYLSGGTYRRGSDFVHRFPFFVSLALLSFLGMFMSDQR